MIQVNISSDVAAELITTAQAKQFIKENFTAGADATLVAEDALIDAMVSAARLACENYCNSTFKQKTLIAWWDTLWYERTFHLPYGPHQSITKVESLDAEESSTTLTLNTDYYKRGIKDFILTVNQIASAPITTVFNDDPISSLKVTYVAGYASGSEPKDIIQAMYDIIGYLYVNRGEIKPVDMLDVITPTAQVLLNPYKRTAL